MSEKDLENLLITCIVYWTISFFELGVSTRYQTSQSINAMSFHEDFCGFISLWKTFWKWKCNGVEFLDFSGGLVIWSLMTIMDLLANLRANKMFMSFQSLVFITYPCFSHVVSQSTIPCLSTISCLFSTLLSILWIFVFIVWDTKAMAINHMKLSKLWKFHIFKWSLLYIFQYCCYFGLQNLVFFFQLGVAQVVERRNFILST